MPVRANDMETDARVSIRCSSALVAGNPAPLTVNRVTAEIENRASGCIRGNCTRATRNGSTTGGAGVVVLGAGFGRAAGGADAHAISR